MSQRLIYIAGPYRAPTVRGILENIRVAEEAALELWRAGFAVICPHKNTALFDGEAPDEVWLKGDISMMLRCDAVVTVVGWSLSEGAMAEIETAIRAGIPVFYSVGELMECKVPICNRLQADSDELARVRAEEKAIDPKVAAWIDYLKKHGTPKGKDMMLNCDFSGTMSVLGDMTCDIQVRESFRGRITDKTGLVFDKTTNAIESLGEP